jgi:hypothetical protein
MRYVFLILLLTSCYKSENNMVIIRKGNHADIHVPLMYINKNELSFDVTFTPSCRYHIGKEQGDNNKLFGVGYLPTHKINSVRFGWWYNTAVDSIEITAYSYRNGVRSMLPMARVAINETNRYTIRMNRDAHNLEISGKAKAEVLTKSSAVMYMLHPYFGGDLPAPHDIFIKMSKA